MVEATNMSSLPPISRIASLSKGQVTVHLNKLHQILRSVKDLRENTPVAIAAVLGPKVMGTYFFSNFLTQYVSNGGHEGWMNELIGKAKLWIPTTTTKENIRWGYPRTLHFQRNEESDGIYLYPQSLLVNKNGSQVLLWIMHAEIDQTVNENIAVKFLALACSMILEVAPKEGAKVKANLLEHYYQIQQNPQPVICESDFCQSATLVIRSQVQTGSVKLHKIETETVLEMMDFKPEGPPAEENFQFLKNAFILYNISKFTCSSKKVVTPDILSIILEISQMVEGFLEKENVLAKTTSNGVLTLGNMEEFIRTVSKKANQWEEMFKTPYSFKIFKTKEDLKALESLNKLLEQEQSNLQIPHKDSVPEQIKCPVCFEVYQNKVFVCLNGHGLCDRCYERVKECPECRVPLENAGRRCRPMEELVNGWKWDCPYKENGCKEILPAKEMNDHVEMCGWRLGTEQKLQVDNVKTQIAEKEAELRGLELSQELDLEGNCSENTVRLDRRQRCQIL